MIHVVSLGPQLLQLIHLRLSVVCLDYTSMGAQKASLWHVCSWCTRYKLSRNGDSEGLHGTGLIPMCLIFLLGHWIPPYPSMNSIVVLHRCNMRQTLVSQSAGCNCYDRWGQCKQAAIKARYVFSIVSMPNALIGNNWISITSQLTNTPTVSTAVNVYEFKSVAVLKHYDTHRIHSPGYIYYVPLYMCSNNDCVHLFFPWWFLIMSSCALVFLSAAMFVKVKFALSTTSQSNSSFAEKIYNYHHSTKLIKICCHLYCYKCIVLVTMPTSNISFQYRLVLWW